MGAHGTGILENDLALDIHDEFFERFDSGSTPESISAELLSQYKDTLIDGEREIMLAVFIECLWNVGHPVEDLREQLTNLIHGYACVTYWGEHYPARKKAITRFLKKCATAKRNPVSRKKHRSPKRRLFEEGDCLAFTKSNGKVVPVIVWIVEPRPPLRYDFVFPNLSRLTPELLNRFFDPDAQLSDQELGLCLGKGLRPKVVTLEHKDAKAHVNRFRRFRRFARRPFRFPTWQAGTCGYCVTFADFEKNAHEGGSRAMTEDELAALRTPD